MDKEKIITIVLGLEIGVLATGGYLLATNYLPKPAKVQPQNPVVAPAPEVSGIENIQLSLETPEDKSSTTSATILVSGNAVAKAAIIIFANADEKIASADADGKFSEKIKLEEGENEISVTAFLNKIASQTIHRNVTLEISQ